MLLFAELTKLLPPCSRLRTRVMSSNVGVCVVGFSLGNQVAFLEDLGEERPIRLAAPRARTGRIAKQVSGDPKFALAILRS